MTTHVIESLAHFLDVLTSRYFTKGGGHWVFRGHSRASYNLVPSLARYDHVEESVEIAESILVRLFRNHLVQHRPQRPEDDYELLAIAQHHGLPTRLLDWTYNAHVALYFAVATNLADDGAVIALKGLNRIDKEPEERKKSPFELDRLWKFVPSMVTSRLVAQDGLFTIHCHIERSLHDYDDTDIEVEKLTIPAAVKKPIAYTLYRLGVHRAKLFPDIDGLAAHLKWMQSVSPEWLRTDDV